MFVKLKDLINKYNSMSIGARASIWYVFCSILQKGIALLATPIFTRLMSTSQYGIYSVYQSWYSIIMIFATLNMYWSAYNNVLTKFEDDRDSATTAMLGLSTMITLFLSIIYAFNHSFFDRLFGLPSIIMLALFVQLLFEPALNFWMVRQRYEYKYKSVVSLTLINAFASTGIGIILVISTQKKGVARVLAYIGVQVIIGIVLYIWQFIRGRKFFSKLYWRYSLKFCVPLIPHYLSYSILNQADRIMISNMIGTGEAAIYSVAYTIAMMMQIITQAITNSLTPYTYQSIKKQDFDGLKKSINAILLFLTLICISIMLFAPEVLKIFASEEYRSAKYVMPPVIASTFFLFLYPLFSVIEFYFEKTKFIMVASSCGAVANIILNYIFIPIYGYYAAGFTTLFCYILFSIAHYIFYKKIINTELQENIELYDMKIVLLTSIIILFATVASMYLYRFDIIRYFIIAVLIVTIWIKRNSFLSLLNVLKK